MSLLSIAGSIVSVTPFRRTSGCGRYGFVFVGNIIDAIGSAAQFLFFFSHAFRSWYD